MTPTCVRCGTAFAANNELATLPHGRRIAFDARRSRVWQVCESCDEWNLLGQDASRAAIPELAARMAATPGQTLNAVTIAPVSRRLTVMEVSTVQAVGDLRVRTGRRLLERRAWWTLAFSAVLLLNQILSAKTWTLDTLRALPDIVLFGAWFASWVFLCLDGWAVLNGYPTRARRAAKALAVFAVTTVLAIALRMWYMDGFIVGVLLVPVGIFSAWIRVPVWMLLEGTRAVRLNQYEIEQVTFDWDAATGEIMLYDIPGWDVVRGEQADRVLRRILAKLPKKTALGDGEQAEALWHAVGGRSGLLAMLGGLRDDKDGRLVIARLPLAFRNALELELQPEVPIKQRDRMLARLPDAHTVADEAEQLDHDIRA